MPRFNPFRPGALVTPGMFSGRATELAALGKALYQAKNENPDHFVIFGERGIGKSSLLLYMSMAANGEIAAFDDVIFKFLTVSIELTPTTTYSELIKKVGAELSRTIVSHEKAKEVAKSAWEFLSRWEAFGISYKGPEKKESAPELLEDLIHTVYKVLSRTAPEIDGLLLLIDEADKPSADAHLGQFVKLFSEGLNKRACNNFLIGLAGLPSIEAKLRASHESALRIFRYIELLPLEWNERIEVLRKGLSKANTKNGYEINASQDAENMIANLSEGYPHFIQEFAYSAFEQDTDNVIDASDVLSGAFKTDGGAIWQLGRRYFESLYFDKIGSEEYRRVLQAMARHFDEWVDKKTIQTESGLKSSTLDNALIALKKRNIILPRRGKKGSYRLPSRSFAAWIRAFTQEPEADAPSLPAGSGDNKEKKAANPAAS